MPDDRLKFWEYMWTTQKDEWVLYSFAIENETKVIMHIPSTKLLTIEDNEVYRAVIEKMRTEGNRIIDKEEVWKLLGRS